MLVVDHRSKQIHLEPEGSEHSLFRKKRFLVICFKTMQYYLTTSRSSVEQGLSDIPQFSPHSMFQHLHLPLNTHGVLHSFSICYIIICSGLTHLSIPQQIN